MTDTTVIAAPAPPRGAILKATAIALAVALVLLVTVVLPAEYGIDPLGTGARLGLSALSQTVVPTLAPAAGGPIATQQLPYKVDAIEFTLIPGGAVEYKYQLNTGAGMLYQWTSSAPVEVDFHTEPEGKPPEASDSFEQNPAATAGRGTYRAPYAGIHGWYWKNDTDKEVTIKLQTAGFYSGAFMFGDDGSKTPMEVMDPPLPPTF
jgi:hypothetical protein